MNIKLSALSSILALFTLSVNAAPILPSNISNATGCGSSQTGCTVDYENQIVAQNFSAVQINRSSGNSWLLHYELNAPSAILSSFEFDGIIEDYTGNIWLEAPTTLLSTQDNIFTVYTDQITPDPDAVDNYGAPSTWVFGLTSADATNGSAFSYFSGDDGSGNVITDGNLTTYDGLISCVECGVDISLNLIGVGYSRGQAFINPVDQRALLLSYNDFDSFYGTGSYERNFYIAPVPVPAALWLFASGLICLAGFSKDKK
jgi:hypothetical protein